MLALTATRYKVSISCDSDRTAKNSGYVSSHFIFFNLMTRPPFAYEHHFVARAPSL